MHVFPNVGNYAFQMLEIIQKGNSSYSK